MKTIQVMPVSGAGQYCVRADEIPFGDDPSPVQALSIVGGSPRLMKRRAMLIISRLPRIVHAENEWLSAVRRAVDYSLKKTALS